MVRILGFVLLLGMTSCGATVTHYPSYHPGRVYVTPSPRYYYTPPRYHYQPRYYYRRHY